MATWHDVGGQELIEEGTFLSVIVAGKRLIIFLHQAQYYALRDSCTHGDARLSDGCFTDGLIECPLHRGTFCIKTGDPRDGPAWESIAAYETRMAAGRIEVSI